MKLKNKIKTKPLRKSWFVFFRISIYTLSIILLVFLLFAHIQNENKKSFKNSFSSKQDGTVIVKNFYTKDYPQIRISFKIEPTYYEELNLNEIDISTIKTLSPLLWEKSSIITSEKELSKKLLNERYPYFPNGSLVRCNFQNFYFEQSKLKRIRGNETNSFFKADTLEKEKLPKEMRYEFANLLSQETMNKGSLLNDNDFPKNLIIEANQKFFLTGTNKISPIFSKKLIQKKWPDFQYISATYPDDNNFKKMDCIKNPIESELVCQTRLNSSQKMKFNVYYFEIDELPVDKIISSETELVMDKKLSGLLNLFKLSL